MAAPGRPAEAAALTSPEGYEEAAALYSRGHELFISRSYDQAIEAYAGVDRFIEKTPGFVTFLTTATGAFPWLIWFVDTVLWNMESQRWFTGCWSSTSTGPRQFLEIDCFPLALARR